VLAAQVFYRGLEEQRHKNFDGAIADFRAALSYDPANYTYELNLAKVLIESQRDRAGVPNQHYVEAESYLGSLAEREPQDGEVNLQLARLAAHDGKDEDAVRYYHRAIYGLWSTEPDANRRRARLELVDFLLDHDQRMDAQAELIASAASLPPDATLHLKIADRLLRAGDFHDALDQYQLAIQFDHNNTLAFVGAGKAAFELGQYRTAQRYLQTALQMQALDEEAAGMLKTVMLILQSDPYRPNLSAEDRRKRFVAAFEQAGARAQACIQKAGQTSDAETTLEALHAQWLAAEPKLARVRAADSSTLEDAMDLTLKIEQAAQAQCGDAQGLDLALLLIARNREGAER
jgi:tetratricopeptide (TPR) repeat protein